MVRPEDASLAGELIEAGVGDLFSIATNPDEEMVVQWVRLIDVLRKAGFEIRKVSDASAGPDFAQAYRRAEPKIRDVLRRLAPPGTAVTPDLISRVQAEVVRVIAGELRASGLPEAAADTLAKLMSAAINIKKQA